ncbi:MAG: PAS domain S-box protein [Candidatus Hydrogenedentes bacterium]|nr:PAS domain S-box protein [Candidatus Hydrogenedentota bacterium]
MLTLCVLLLVSSLTVQILAVLLEERNRKERALHENEQKYRELVENANSIILRWSHEGKITFLNEFGQRFFGYSAEEILGRHVVGTIVPLTESSGRDLKPLIEQICANPKAFEQNVNENVRRNGERVWVAWTNRITRDEQGQVLGILSVGTDITAQKEAQDALRRSEEQFRLITENLADLVVVLDLEGKRLYSSPSYGGILGNPDSLRGTSSFEQVHPDDRDRVQAAFRETVRTGQGHRLEYRLVDQDGKPRHIESQGSVIRDAQGQVAQVVVVSRDITERLLAEKAVRELNATLERRVVERTAELELAKERAESADRLKSAFLAAMSHELRTPLNSIIGFTGIVLQELPGPLNPEQTKQLKMVQGSARHLLALINDVLDLSKIEAGQLEVEAKPFNARESIERVMHLVAPMAEAKGLTLSSDISPEVDHMVNDRRRFEQILINLINNGLKFTEKGGVRVDCTIEGSDLVTRVRDTGIGIKPEDMGTLFQAFRQIDAGLTRNHEGTGLGLSICKRLIEKMGGRIWAESEWGVGSAFGFTLPVSQS